MSGGGTNSTDWNKLFQTVSEAMTSICGGSGGTGNNAGGSSANGGGTEVVTQIVVMEVQTRQKLSRIYSRKSVAV